MRGSQHRYWRMYEGAGLKVFISLLVAALFVVPLQAQGTVPVFHFAAGKHDYTLVGNSPEKGGVTRVPVVLVPVTLTFAGQGSGKPEVFDASADIQAVLHSPLFRSYRFSSGRRMQYGDALLRASVPHAATWHTLLVEKKIVPVKVTIPAADGYTLYSRKSGRRFAVVDRKFLLRSVFNQLPAEHGKLVIAFTDNATYYAIQDATVCCSWGTHGTYGANGESFVLSTYLHRAPAIVRNKDIQPLTQQLAEFLYDPLHDPLHKGSFSTEPGNHFATWRRPLAGGCAGNGVGSNYFLLDPTNTNLKNDFPQSPSFAVNAGGARYHVENVALLSWYLRSGQAAAPYSFPDVSVLKAPSSPCGSVRHHAAEQKASGMPAESAAGEKAPKHKLIGYWVSRAPNGKLMPLRDVSPAWNIVIVSFASPVAGAPQGTLRFGLPKGITARDFKKDVAYLKSRGQKVMVSLGGGGQFVHLGSASAVPNFVHSVERLVADWGFQGIDIDFESPSLDLSGKDTDFRHPVNPSTVHLIMALRELHRHFGPHFMISLVPEGTQIPAGYRSYGGQFGSELPIVYALRHILAFVDVQDYNTPPLEGMDGEIYQAHTADYYAATTELLLHGFPVAGNPKEQFPALPADKVVTGFLVNYANPSTISAALHWIISGKAPARSQYHLLHAGGYSHFLGAMFWNIDEDWVEGGRYSNRIGPQLHGNHP